MKPIVITIEAVLGAPPSVVWRVITDWEAQGDWMLEARDFVVVSPHREGVGVEAEATVKVAGIATRDRIRIDVWEPERTLGIVHLGWVGGRGDLSLAAAGGATNFLWREELVPPWGIIGAIGLHLFRPLLARTFRRDVRELDVIVRRSASGPVR